MKHIIFEVINKILLKRDQLITFGPEVVSNLIEIINFYGMSVMKFKRILKLLIADFFEVSQFIYHPEFYSFIVESVLFHI